MKTIFQVFRLINSDSKTPISENLPNTKIILEPVEHQECEVAYKAANVITHTKNLPKGNYIVLPIWRND